MSDPLSEERITAACETLDAAFGKFLHGEIAGAVDGDPAMAMAEAKRNLMALLGQLRAGLATTEDIA